MSAASEHDTLHFEDALDPASANRNILADKGYVDAEREARLSKQGWRVHIQRKGRKDKPISETQKRRNHRIAKTRAPSMCSPVWRRWVARRCVRSARGAPRCT